MEYSEIKKIMKDMEELKLTEFSLELPDGTKISLKREALGPAPEIRALPNIPIMPSQNIKPIAVQENKEMVKVEENYKIVKSPMVGTFYEKPSPTAKKFVEVGDKVKKGDILCIIEAMKLMNEIESEYDGEIVEILVKDGEMVDYGKPLFKIK